jgi:hypothetical protein
MSSIQSFPECDYMVSMTPAIPGLPNHLVVAHVVGSDKLNDPTDLVRLTAVSRGMRAAVAATNRTIKKPNEDEAVQKGYLSTLKHMHSVGRLSHKGHLCAAAARCGDLEELKALRADDCPWYEGTCAYAAMGGHLEVLKWARDERLPVGWTASGGVGHLSLSGRETAALDNDVLSRRRAATSRC